MKDDDILQRIAAAAGGLCYPSERDAPLLPFRWAGSGDPTPETVCCAQGQGQRVNVVVEDVLGAPPFGVKTRALSSAVLAKSGPDSV